MQLSIIIPTKDRGDIFNESLESALKAIDGLEAEIIVINDSKTSGPKCQDAAGKIILVDNPGNGVASARNLGASLAKGEVLIFMDDDFIVQAEHIVNAIDLVHHHPDQIYLFNWTYPPSVELSLKDFQFGRYLSAFGFTSLKGWLGPEWKDDDVFELKGGASYFMPIQKITFEKIGGYNEAFKNAGAEDYDFVQKARGLGIRFFLDNRHVLYHNERDRLEPISWLERKKRNGETISVAVELGHEELTVHYSIFKFLTLSILSKIRPWLLLIQRGIPNFIMLDWMYFGLTNILYAIYFFDGYSKGKR